METSLTFPLRDGERRHGRDMRRTPFYGDEEEMQSREASPISLEK
ncbi:hypothetical protein AB1K84_02285 [Mesobacillus foraminis]